MEKKDNCNYVKVGALHWPWKGTDFTDVQVNFGKFLFLRGCIDMWEDAWLNFFLSIAFAP